MNGAVETETEDAVVARVLARLLKVLDGGLRDDQDELLDVRRVAQRLGIHARNVPAYVERWPDLLAAARVVRVKAGGRGRLKVLKSAVLNHMRDALR